MTVKLIVATELANKDLRDEITSLVEALSNIELIAWQDGIGEKGDATTNIHPDVVIIDDAPQFGPMPERIVRLRKNHPHVTVFIASQEQNPGQIVAAMKAGAAEFLISPFNKKIVSRALDEVRESIQKNRNGSNGRVFSFISAKGGLGSTVLATNSGVVSAHQYKQRTALCDLSCQSGDSAVLLDLSPKTDMADIAENFHRLDLAMLRDCMCRHGSGLELLSAPFRPERCETIKPDHVSHILEMLNQLYEVIFIDCTSMFVNPSEIEAFRSSETIFIVTDLSVPALRNASRLAHYINGLGISHDRIEYVANRFHKGGTLGLSQAEETLGKRIFWLFPNDYDDVVTSINEGKPVAQLAPHSTISESIKGFIDRLLNPKADPKFRGMRGRFGKAL